MGRVTLPADRGQGVSTAIERLPPGTATRWPFPAISDLTVGPIILEAIIAESTWFFMKDN